MKHSLYHVIRGPVVTEKTAQLQERFNQVCLHVHHQANKPLIRRALHQCFDVRAVDVRVCLRRGKLARVGRHLGRHANTKRAFVTLKDAADVEKLGIDLSSLSQENPAPARASAQTESPS